MAHPKNVMKVVSEAFLARVRPVASIAKPAGMSQIKAPASNCQAAVADWVGSGGGEKSAARASGPGRTLESATAKASMPKGLLPTEFLSHIPLANSLRSHHQNRYATPAPSVNWSLMPL